MRNAQLKTRVSRLALCTALSGLVGTAAAAPLPSWDGSLPAAGNPLTSQQYQDFTIYSLNYLTNLASLNATPDKPYYSLLKPISYDVASGVGQLGDKVVLVTGNTGNVQDNTDTCGATGCDEAYPYPSPQATYFSTITTTEPVVAVPGEPASSFWSAEVSALRNYLAGQDMVFMFNLNEDNGGDANTLDGQSLLVSMKVDVTFANGDVSSYYVGANNAIGLLSTAEQLWNSDGAPVADPTDPNYNPMLQNIGLNGYISGDARWAYVHGAISVNTATGAFLGMGDCNYTAQFLPANTPCTTVNQNLGANQVAFSAFNEELSGLIRNQNSGAVRMDVTALTSGQSNGFEQLFIMAADIPDRTVPEPASLSLIGLALAGFAAIRRRRIAA